ncbi:MAG: hypothetical protein CSB48_10045 [Proteobacteria bacterium]|nr:MAG: hypothetical protein CSB48_10045 [Pseudomonadota bacterium]
MLTGLCSTAIASELTIYSDFAVVNDDIELELKAGINKVSYTNITRSLEPSSVMVSPADPQWQVLIQEQSYLGEPVSETSLLQKYEGETIDFLVQYNDHESVIRGKIIRAPQSYDRGTLPPMIELDGKLRFDLPGLPLFPPTTADSLLKPQLNWILHANRSGKAKANISYLTDGFGWAAAYNFIQTSENKMDAAGWLTLENDSGKTFPDVKVRLVAGNANKTRPAEDYWQVTSANSMMAANKAMPSRKEIDEFHLYTVPGQINLKAGETKQIQFIQGQNINFRTELVYDGAELPASYDSGNIRASKHFGTQSSHAVDIYKLFENSLENGLGKPLPQGIIRFYQQDESGLVFIGENAISHTAVDQVVKTFTGTAFDVTGERKQTGFVEYKSQKRTKESVLITLENRKEVPVEVKVVEHLYRGGRYELSSTENWQKENAETIYSRVKVPAKSERQISYSVVYQW